MLASCEASVPNPYFVPITRKEQRPLPANAKATKRQRQFQSKSELSLDSLTERSDHSSKSRQPKWRKPIKTADLTALYTVVKPPPQFASQIKVDVTHIDLKWLCKDDRDSLEVLDEAAFCTLTNMRLLSSDLCTTKLGFAS